MGEGEPLKIMLRRMGSEVTGSLFWLGLGILFALGGISLNVGTLRNPGPGFLPLMMALFLIFFSLSILIKGLMQPKEALPGVMWKRQSFSIVSVFLYMLLLEWVDFLLSTAIFMFILFCLLLHGKNRWQKRLFYSVAVALAAWLIFYVAIKIPFPSPRLISIWS